MRGEGKELEGEGVVGPLGGVSERTGDGSACVTLLEKAEWKNVLSQRRS